MTTIKEKKKARPPTFESSSLGRSFFHIAELRRASRAKIHPWLIIERGKVLWQARYCSPCSDRQRCGISVFGSFFGESSPVAWRGQRKLARYSYVKTPYTSRGDTVVDLTYRIFNPADGPLPSETAPKTPASWRGNPTTASLRGLPQRWFSRPTPHVQSGP